MAAHAAVRVRHHGSLAWALPVTLGVAYGFYAGFLRRTGRDVNWGDVLFGVVCGIIVVALAYGLGRIQQSLSHEVRAAAYATLFGGATGYLFSQTGASVLKSSVMGLVLAGAMAVSAFYVFHTRE
jgi:drug/metabolite transporter (DMT)-like permease